MSNKPINIEIKIDEKYDTPKITIQTSQVTDEISTIINNIKNQNSGVLIGFKNEEAYMLEISKIELIYTEDKKIFARVDNDAYQIKKRIFELEEYLSSAGFVRISNSEIVNFKKVSSIDFKFTGTIMLKLKSGKNTFVSRRYVKRIKEYLEL